MSKKHILLIGVGGTGSHAVDLLYQKIKANEGMNNNNKVFAIVFDTDAADESRCNSGVTKLSMTDPRPLSAVVSDLGSEELREWFPIEPAAFFWNDKMDNGAAQWRKKSYLAFVNLLNSNKRLEFERAMDAIIDRENADTGYEIYTVSSIAGGTGSGSFIPITLYAKKYFKTKHSKLVPASAMVACPDIYEKALNPDQKIKVYANAYAILRELNAMNRVAKGYNSVSPDDAEEKHAPARFRLALPSKISDIGVLFDSMSETSQTPSAAPFDKVYLLDKVATVDDVATHDNILANSLYTILCTDVGAKFETAGSNDAAVKSAIENRNAIYAGVATSELVYPFEKILHYCACRQAEESCSTEWLILHRATEEKIAEAMRVAKEQRYPYSEKPGDYAERFLSSYSFEVNKDNSVLEDILREGVKVVGDNDQYVDRVDGYISRMLSALRGELAPKADECNDKIKDFATLLKKTLEEHGNSPIEKPGLFAGAAGREAAAESVRERAETYANMLNGFYRVSIEMIRRKKTSLADCILPEASDKSLDSRMDLSLTENLLKKNGKFVHPVAAMTVLCQLRKKLKEMNLDGIRPLADVDARNVDRAVLPTSLYTLSATGASKGCFYAELGDDRLVTFLSEESAEDYRRAKTNHNMDATMLRDDVTTTLASVEKTLNDQLKRVVLTAIEDRVERLIKQYRTFFVRFEKDFNLLSAQTGAALRAGSKSTGDAVNILADEASKKQAYEEYRAECGAASLDELIAGYDLAGKSVFESSFNALCNETSVARNDGKAAKNTSISALFEALIKSYREMLRRSSYFANQAEKSIFEIIADTCGVSATATDIFKAIKERVNVAVQKAMPALQVNNYDTNSTEAKPSAVQVLMMDRRIAEYLRNNAERFGLDPDLSDDDISQQFLGRVGISDTRIALTDAGKAHSVFVTRKTENIQPTHISKICESSENPTYFRYYQQSLSRMVGNDVYNPHLGFGWHQRGNLPYIDSKFEEKENQKLAKALLYAIMTGRLAYGRERRSGEYGFAYIDNGRSVFMRPDGTLVNDKNISGLIGWLRMQDARIEEWSAAFDTMVAKERSHLLRYESDSNLRMVSAAITNSSVISMMRENLFANAILTKSSDFDGAEDAVSKEDSRINWNLLEFAYALKSSEENSMDCDDAEKILKVGFETLDSFCRHCVPKNNEQAWYDIYAWQLEKFAGAVLTSDRNLRERDPARRLRGILEWANNNGCFCDARPVGENEYEACPYELPKTLLAELAKAKAAKEEDKKAYFGRSAAEPAAPATEPADPSEQG